VRNKHEAFPVIDVARGTPSPVGYAGAEQWRHRPGTAVAFFFRPALKKETPVVLCFCALDIEGNLA